MFDGASNVQLAGKLLKIHYPKVSVMRGVEHIVSLFFNNFSERPGLNQMITDQGQYITYLVLEYITNLILYSNQNHMSFTIETLDCSVEMISGWLVISLECTYICA